MKNSDVIRHINPPRQNAFMFKARVTEKCQRYGNKGVTVPMFIILQLISLQCFHLSRTEQTDMNCHPASDDIVSVLDLYAAW
jgi:hypothetical protein